MANQQSVQTEIVTAAADYAVQQNSAIEVPQVGMIFGSPDEAFQFYKKYSCKLGFGVTRRSSHTYYGFKYDVTFSCNKNRKPDQNKQQEGFGTRTRGILGTGCKAHIKLKDLLLSGSWTIQEVVTDHNHDLSPDSVRHMRCHRELPLFVKKQLEINEMAGLAQNKSISAVFTQAGGVTKCTFTERDMRNFVSEYRRLNLRHGDAAALMNYFHEQQTRTSNFFYSCDIDDDGRLRNVFWSDARSREAYKYFSDVITFDTTYLTNRYRMPFAVFVDKCSAMAGGIAQVLPTTRHRLCLWHILKKLPEKLAGVKLRDEIIEKVCAAVYDSRSPTTFESSWKDICNKYDLGTQAQWFRDMEGIRHKWILAFVKHQFWEGMSMTQRSESMNAFFDGYVNSRTSLTAFVEKYSAALHSKWEKERLEDWRCKETEPKLISDITFEKQFSKAYTLKLFYQFQNEIKLLMNCFCEPGMSSITEQTFRVSELVTGEEYCVTYTNGTQEYKCECLLFEFKGIVCRHGLCVYRQLRIDELPCKYILNRWRKDYIRSHTEQIVPQQIIYRDIRMYNDVYVPSNQILQDLVELAGQNPELHQMLVQGLTDLKEKMIPLIKKNNIQPTLDFSPVSNKSVVMDPFITRSKGRPRKNRIPGGVENKKVNKKKQHSTPKGQKKAKTKHTNDQTQSNPPPSTMEEEGSTVTAQTEQFLLD